MQSHSNINQQFDLLEFYDETTQQLKTNCLHMALEYPQWKQLSALLVQRGADPLWEDADKYTVVERFVEKKYQNFNRLMSYKTHSAHERMINCILALMREEKRDVLLLLEALETYGIFARFPNLINDDYDENNDVLRNAILHHSWQVVDFLLKKKIDIFANRNRWKLFEDIAYKIKTYPMLPKRLEIFIQSSGLFVLHYIQQTIAKDQPITARNILDVIARFELEYNHKKMLCQAIYSFNFLHKLDTTEIDLMSLLEARENNNFDLAVSISSKAEPIGQGGWGQVYQGTLEDKKQLTTKKVALKIAKEDDALLLHEEVFIHSTLLHPHIIKFLNICIHKEQVGILMEFADQRTLYQFIHQRNETAIDMEIFFALALQILSAIQYLHDRNLIHLDIKPSNILLNKANANEYEIKLCDFGHIAIQGERKVHETTYIYCDPHLLKDDAKCDKKNDIWSLGCVFGEWDTKEFPISIPANQQLNDKAFILAGHKKKLYPDFDGVKLSSPVKKIVKSCVQYDINKRPDHIQLAALVAKTRLSFFPINKKEKTSISTSKKRSFLNVFCKKR